MGIPKFFAFKLKLNGLKLKSQFLFDVGHELFHRI